MVGGLAGRKIPRRRGLTRPGNRPAFADFLRRYFSATAPGQVWAGDMTEIVTSEGKLYLATVIDLFSRRLLGYAMGERHDAELVVASLHMAAATRGGDVRGVIFHSDRGSEYQSRRFMRACRRLGVTQSMGRVGSCFDNAVSEAFNSVLKVEYVHRRAFATRTEARLKIATWITDFYNTRRLHSVCADTAARSTTNETIRPTPPWSWPLERSPRREGIDSCSWRWPAGTWEPNA
ncbi:IS3 family transposase [Streptomyces sp. NPDC056660]|uniref:IS3 family transposase n=1 Tax=Streptomyces sp. NPDC056660 TaxID=3345897 RepID=UPI0036CF2807